MGGSKRSVDFKQSKIGRSPVENLLAARKTRRRASWKINPAPPTKQVLALKHAGFMAWLASTQSKSLNLQHPKPSQKMTEAPTRKELIQAPSEQSEVDSEQAHEAFGRCNHNEAKNARGVLSAKDPRPRRALQREPQENGADASVLFLQSCTLCSMS